MIHRTANMVPRPNPIIHREKSIASSEERPTNPVILDKNPEISRSEEAKTIIEPEKVEDMEEGEIPQE